MNAQNRGNLTYAVDIVLCIDVTASMGPVLEQVKKSALGFHIAFRDFADDPDDALETTDFLTFPDQEGEYEDFVRRLEPSGGGDIPESGLEALALAIRSPWETGLDRRRHVVVLFTDAPAHPLGDPDACSVPGYPADIPRSLDDLFEEWGYARSQTARMDNSAKRLVLFTPDEEPWSEIAEEWNLTMHFPSRAGEGLEELEMDEIVNTIAHSL